jgi:cytoskeleton-associated protein 5
LSQPRPLIIQLHRFFNDKLFFFSTVLDYCITDIADKLGDVKNGSLAAETLTSLAEATKLELVATEVMNFAFIQKSPKVQQEALSWLSTAIREFGFQRLAVLSMF